MLYILSITYIIYYTSKNFSTKNFQNLRTFLKCLRLTIFKISQTNLVLATTVQKN